MYTAYYCGLAPGGRPAAARYVPVMALPGVLVQRLRAVAETRPAVAAPYHVTGMAVDLTDVSRAGAFLALAIVRGGE